MRLRFGRKCFFWGRGLLSEFYGISIAFKLTDSDRIFYPTEKLQLDFGDLQSLVQTWCPGTGTSVNIAFCWCPRAPIWAPCPGTGAGLAPVVVLGHHARAQPLV